MREGRLAYRGDDAKGVPIFQQKRVDLMIGLDVAGLAAERAITHAAVLAGDSDLLPAFESAQQKELRYGWCTVLGEPMPASFGTWPMIGSRSKGLLS